jgi:hypothetical protein
MEGGEKGGRFGKKVTGGEKGMLQGDQCQRREGKGKEGRMHDGSSGMAF